ncbi:MAG: lipoate--protein ligase [Desulfonatronovibrionaceae bacterium]
MLCIHNKTIDPYFNLAAEEYLLKNEEQEYFLLWRNPPSIIVGRNQNARAEINEEYVRDHSIPVVRRLSGGGAVFHDLGNINFTLISRKQSRTGLDFKHFARPVVRALQGMGVPAEFDGRNDLAVAGKKISGNAQHVWRDSVLHHGTLLFDSDVKDLTKALQPDELKFRDKAVKSVRSRVTNIRPYLPKEVTIEGFMQDLLHTIQTDWEDSCITSFTRTQEKAVYALRDEKYSSWEWNFGTAPPYTHSRKKRTPGGTVELVLNVRKGIIQTACFYGDFFGQRDVTELAERLRGVRHDPGAVAAALKVMPIREYLWDVSLEDILELV